MRLLVVEDEAPLASLLHAALERAGFAVDVTPNLAEAEAHLPLAGYDAAILDLNLPDGDGLALLARLRRRGDALPVLILTARDAPDARVMGLDTGADDYLVKPFHMPELISRVRALLRRPSAALGVRLEVGNVRLDTPSRSIDVAGAPMALSPRETSLLELLLRRAGKVVAREAIESGLYSFDAPTGPNAVEVAIHRLRRRLAEAAASVRIHTVRGVGYMLMAE
jgi:DNA-binding response OmpR family regulator